MAAIDTLAKTPHRLLLMGSTKAPERAFLRAVFERVIVPNDEVQLLALDEQFEMPAAPGIEDSRWRAPPEQA